MNRKTTQTQSSLRNRVRHAVRCRIDNARRTGYIDSLHSVTSVADGRPNVMAKLVAPIVLRSGQ